MSHQTQTSADNGLRLLPPELLQRVFTHVPFRDKMLCEGVCRMWRAILRCSDLQRSITGNGLSGIWGNLIIAFEGSPDHEEMFPDNSYILTLCRRRQNSANYATFKVRGSGVSLTQQEREFVAWMGQRAVGSESINLQYELFTQDPGWMFAELVLAISSSGGHFSARPPVTLVSDMGSVPDIESVFQRCLAISSQSLFLAIYVCCCYIGLDALQSLKGCELIAGSLTSWRTESFQEEASSVTAAEGMQLAQNLGILTRLTYLSLTDDGHLGDLPQLTALRQLHTLCVSNWGQAPHRGQALGTPARAAHTWHTRNRA